MWEIANVGDIPYPNISTLDALVDFLKDGKRMNKPAHCSDALYALMLSCWQESPSNRPDFVDLKNRVSFHVFSFLQLRAIA